MDHNNQADVDRWANDRLASLRSDPDWQPDLSRGLARLRDRDGAERGIRQRWGWVMAGIAAMGLPLMALPMTRAIAQRCVSACVQESSRMREFLVGPGLAPSSTFVARADRKIAPDFTVTDASGRQVSLSDFRGKTVLLNFWATWCSPCKVEIPMLKGLQQRYLDNGFTVLGVSMDDGWGVVRPYMTTAQFNYPILMGNEDLAKQYGGMDAVLPTTLLIDKSGRIAAFHVGLCNRSEYEADINAVLKEQ